MYLYVKSYIFSLGNNFSLFYSYAQARLKLPKKSQIALVGAANVLVADTNSSHSDELDSGEENLSGCESPLPKGEFSCLAFCA